MFEDVNALLSEKDKRLLQGISLLASNIPGDYIEVGSFEGGSTLNICHNMPLGKTLFAIDHGVDSSKKLLSNLEKYNVRWKVNFINYHYNDAFNTIPDDQIFAFAFIDTDHTYENTQVPAEYLWEKISPFGFMVFHDYEVEEYEDVQRFVDEFAKQGDDKNIIGHIGVCFVIQKIK